MNLPLTILVKEPPIRGCLGCVNSLHIELTCMKLTWPRSISDLEKLPVSAVVWSGKRKVTLLPLI